MQGRDFNRSFNNMRRAAIAWFIFCAILGLGTLGGLLFVAWHFLSKNW